MFEVRRSAFALTPKSNCPPVPTGINSFDARGSSHSVQPAERGGQPSADNSGPYAPVCSLFRRYLHEQKLKFTPERAMMLDAVLRKAQLFEPEQLIDDLKQLGHRVSRATVYRTLSHLQDAGILRQVFFDNRQSYYQVIVGRKFATI